ncbi:MAG: carboxypeptidase regulatory-like domain-containing protein [Bryobacteraceae bacterium]
MKSFAAGLAAAAAAVLWAQAPVATLVGRIEDSSGSPIPAATVRTRHLDTSEVLQVIADENGEYTIPRLVPGEYDVTVEHPGFRATNQRGLVLQIDQTARLDVRLQVGDVTESIEVKAELPVLNTENAIRGEVIVTEEIAAMPLDGRDFADLAHLVPGVMRRAQGGQGSAFNINGARADNTNFIIDGFNDQNPRGGAAQARPPIDALLEFKMQTSGYSPEYGRLAGGVMNMVLKSGGNQFHGTLFEYLRNDKFDARNFFDAEKSKLRRNQFGAVVSGPVLLPRLYNGRDRTFFLASWESYRQALGSTRLGRVPGALEREGNFSDSRAVDGTVAPLRDPLLSGTCGASSSAGCFPDNRVPLSRFSPISQKVMAYYPPPNRPLDRNNYLTNANDVDRWDSFLGKIDQRFSASDSISVRALTRQNNTTNPFAGSDLAGFGSKVDERQSLAGFSYIRMMSPASINEFRGGLIRTSHYEPSVNAGRDFASEFGITGTTTDPFLTGFPRFTILNLLSLGDAASNPVLFTVNNWEWADTLTLVHSRHLFKFGAGLLRSQFSQTANNNNRGTFAFLDRWTNHSFADFLLGLPNSASRQAGTITSYLYSTSFSLFAQDDWKIRPNLTLNLGLRWELLKPLTEKYGRLANFIPELGKIIVTGDRNVPDFQQRLADANLVSRVGLARDYDLPDSLVYTRYNNFAPRFGLAWRPRGGVRSVVRGGYGIFYGNSVSNPVRGDLAVTFPFIVSQTFNRLASNVNAVTLSNPFPANRITLDGVNNSAGYELHAPSQNLQSWNLTIERQIGPGSAIEAAYIGSKGTHLGRRYDLNQPFRVPELRVNGNFPRPFTGINTINFFSFGSNSTYNAGVFSIRKRFDRGFFYRFNYTYSKSIDDASQISGNADGGYPGAQNARNLRADRGRSDWDTGHSATLNFSYELPLGASRLWRRGWQLAGSGRFYSGQPFTPRTSNVDLNAGEANRPDRIAKGSVDEPSQQGWFDLLAFPLVPNGAFRFGNSGRNVLDGPGYASLNLSLSKRFPIRERQSLQLRWETFNVLNHTNFSQPENFVNAPNGATIINASSARTMQIALKYYF